MENQKHELIKEYYDSISNLKLIVDKLISNEVIWIGHKNMPRFSRHLEKQIKKTIIEKRHT
jgi:hypothetical protein